MFAPVICNRCDQNVGNYRRLRSHRCPSRRNAVPNTGERFTNRTPKKVETRRRDTG